MSDMNPTASDSSQNTVKHGNAATAQVYRFLALACSDPNSARWKKLFDPTERELALSAWQELLADPAFAVGPLAPGERAPEGEELKSIVASLDNHECDHTAAHDSIFGLVISKECPPYETQYCPQTFSVYRSGRMADIAGFYSAFGVTPSRDQPERVDHIALEL